MLLRRARRCARVVPRCSSGRKSSGDVRADADIEDLLRLVNAIALATEDTPEGHAQADRMFALLMDGVRAHDAR